MTPEQLWKLAFRTCEAKIRKSGPVFSEAEIMAEFPGVDFEARFKEAEAFLKRNATEALFAQQCLANISKEYKCPTK